MQTVSEMKRMGRESESLLLYRPQMSIAEATMWLLFDIGLTALQCLAPVSLVVLLAQNTWRVIQGKSFIQYHLEDETVESIEHFLEAWFVVEVVFFIYIKIKARRLRSAERVAMAHRLTRDQRELLLSRVLDTVDSVEAFFEQWFADPNIRFTDLTRAHVAEVVAYSLFHCKRSDLNETEVEELELVLRRFEEKLGRRIPDKAMTMAEEEEEKLFELLMAKSAMFFTETEISYQHRPLVMYLVVDHLFQRILAPIRMRFMGGYASGRVNSTSFWLRRPASAVTQDGNHHARDSIVFLHGIGVGLLPYSLFLERLEKMADARGVDLIVVEIPVISQTLSPSSLLPDAFARDIHDIVTKKAGCETAKFITHSYGSFCVNWVVNRYPELVGGLMLIDPAAVLLHHTDILYNMLYRPPGNTSLDRVLHYIMRAELHFVHHLKREFLWFHNTMFLDGLPAKCRVFLVLSEADQVIPVKRIAKYATQSNVPFIVLKQCDHGGFLVERPHLEAVLSAIDGWLSTTTS